MRETKSADALMQKRESLDYSVDKICYAIEKLIFDTGISEKYRMKLFYTRLRLQENRNLNMEYACSPST